MAKTRKKAKKLTGKKQSVKDLSASKARSVKGGALSKDRQPLGVTLS
jgi:hypothetical protein